MAADPVAVAGGVASGQVAMISRDKQGVRLATLVGGTELRVGDIAITLSRPEYRATIRSANYTGQSIAIDQPLPARVLDGELFTIGNDRRHTTYRAVKVADKSVTFDRVASIYRGGVDYLDEAQGFAVLDVAPYLHSYHPDYYQGATAVNEAGRVLGRATVRLGDRFFYTGWPEVRRHLNKIDPQDISDANGDGKVTVAMYVNPLDEGNAGGTRRLLEDGTVQVLKPGEKMLDLEVTRVREDGFMLYAKQYPREFVDSIKLPHPGWPYHQQLIRNEAGTREWTVNMPGDTCQMVIDGKKLTAADLPDPNKDDRPAVYLYDYGPGDEIAVPGHVHLRRLAPGLFEMRANAACSVELPAAGAAVSLDSGKTWQPMGTVANGRVRIELSEQQLADGVLQMRLN
jgi:hypothetical protein